MPEKQFDHVTRFRSTDEFKQKLERVSKEKGVKPSALIRDVVNVYLDDHDRGVDNPALTVAELRSDLRGADLLIEALKTELQETKDHESHAQSKVSELGSYIDDLEKQVMDLKCFRDGFHEVLDSIKHTFKHIVGKETHDQFIMDMPKSDLELVARSLALIMKRWDELQKTKKHYMDELENADLAIRNAYEELELHPKLPREVNEMSDIDDLIKTSSMTLFELFDKIKNHARTLKKQLQKCTEGRKNVDGFISGVRKICGIPQEVSPTFDSILDKLQQRNEREAHVRKEIAKSMSLSDNSLNGILAGIVHLKNQRKTASDKADVFEKALLVSNTAYVYTKKTLLLYKRQGFWGRLLGRSPESDNFIDSVTLYNEAFNALMHEHKQQPYYDSGIRIAINETEVDHAK